MDLYLIILGIILFGMTIKNVLLIKKSANAKGYTAVYQAFLRDEEDADEKLIAYLAKENNPEFLNKARIIKVYKDIDDNGDAIETVNSIDFKELMFAKGKFNSEMYANNADSNLWLILDLVKAKKENKSEIADLLIRNIEEYNEYLKNYVEYNTLTSIYKCLCDNEEGKEFLNKLLSGDYSGYLYNKKMVGVFKKLAACILAYKNELTNEDDILLVKDFANNYMGRKILKDLDIYEQYKPADVIEDTTKEIENKEEK